MDDNTLPMSTPSNDTNVDALLDGILSGQQPETTASVEPAPQPSSHYSVENRIDSLLSGSPTPQSEFSQDFVASNDVTPQVASQALPTETAPLSPVTPLGGGLASIEANTAPQPPMVQQEYASQTPSPGVAAAAPVVPSAGFSFPKAPIAAAIAVFAVVLGGIGAGVALSGQNQDVRQQAYVEPAPVQNVGQPGVLTAVPEIIVAPTAHNAFLMAQSLYPSAASHVISGSGVTGTLYSAQSAEGKTILFAEMTGVQDMNENSTPTAWVEYADGTFMSIGTLFNEEGKAYINYENLSDLVIAGFIVSYENPATFTDMGVGTQPTEKVIDVRL